MLLKVSEKLHLIVVLLLARAHTHTHRLTKSEVKILQYFSLLCAGAWS
jgi:hypothetical protein